MEVQNSTEEFNLWKGQADYIDKWFLMSNPYPVLAIMTSYLLFVLKIGPDYMKKRPPMKLNNIVMFYNIVQVFFSLYLFNFGTRLLMRHGLLTSDCLIGKEAMMPVSVGSYYYFTAKITELLDTVFFVLRKKNNQVSFLHVYHHSVVVVGTWWALKYEPSLTPIFLGTLNSFVHVVMYGYYALSTFPGLAPYLWWKRYITKMQLIQFVLVIIQLTANYAYTGCPPSNFLLSLMMFNLVLMIVLFSNFYANAYSKKKLDESKKFDEKITKDVKSRQKFLDAVNNNENGVNKNVK